MSGTILITGATSGFGKAIAEKFAANGCRCIITGRRKERLESMEALLKEKYQAEVFLLNFDVPYTSQLNPTSPINQITISCYEGLKFFNDHLLSHHSLSVLQRANSITLEQIFRME